MWSNRCGILCLRYMYWMKYSCQGTCDVWSTRVWSTCTVWGTVHVLYMYWGTRAGGTCTIRSTSFRGTCIVWSTRIKGTCTVQSLRVRGTCTARVTRVRSTCTVWSTCVAVRTCFVCSKKSRDLLFPWQMRYHWSGGKSSSTSGTDRCLGQIDVWDRSMSGTDRCLGEIDRNKIESKRRTKARPGKSRWSMTMALISLSITNLNGAARVYNLF